MCCRPCDVTPRDVNLKIAKITVDGCPPKMPLYSIDIMNALRFSHLVKNNCVAFGFRVDPVKFRCCPAIDGFHVKIIGGWSVDSWTINIEEMSSLVLYATTFAFYLAATGINSQMLILITFSLHNNLNIPAKLANVQFD